MTMTTAPEAPSQETRLDWAIMILGSVFGVLYVISRYGVMRGHHALLIFVHAFAVIVTVNLTLAYSAVSTFPGLEVKNSYVASQSFDTDRATQQALGWDVGARIDGGVLSLTIDKAGRVVRDVEILKATLGRPTHVYDDVLPVFTHDGSAFVADLPDLKRGNWDLWIEARAADGTVFKQRMTVKVTR